MIASWITSKRADVNATSSTNDYAFVATETEAEEILAEAKVFNAFVEKWISLENPSLAKRAPG